MEPGINALLAPDRPAPTAGHASGDQWPSSKLTAGPAAWQRRLFIVIFRHDTGLGRAFDLGVLLAIVLSVIVVMIESVEWAREAHPRLLYAAEWVFTLLFTVEYVLRLACVRERRAYATSFFGIVDLMAILPTYLSLLVPGAQGLATIRALRLLRIFRILKLVRFSSEATALRAVLWGSRAKIIVFLMTICIVACIIGALMYVVERPHNPDFSSIPQSIYWAVVTMATVGYGDIVPVTVAGKLLAVALIVFGYSMIVVPTGIVTAEFGQHAQRARESRVARRRCASCGKTGHDDDAAFCNRCAAPL